jgi:hypothetical protein
MIFLMVRLFKEFEADEAASEKKIRFLVLSLDMLTLLSASLHLDSVDCGNPSKM